MKIDYKVDGDFFIDICRLRLGYFSRLFMTRIDFNFHNFTSKSARIEKIWLKSKLVLFCSLWQLPWNIFINWVNYSTVQFQNFHVTLYTCELISFFIPTDSTIFTFLSIKIKNKVYHHTRRRVLTKSYEVLVPWK